MAEEFSKHSLVFVATAQPKDEEMLERIKYHKFQRSDRWRTFEEPLEIGFAIDNAFAEGAKAVVVDCLTLWVSNLLEKYGATEAEERILTTVKAIETKKTQRQGLCVFVTNEVGLGIVPDNPLARLFRDLAGRANQLFAQLCDEVYFVIAGIAKRIK